RVPESAFSAPVITLMSVDFPAPFSPSSACTSPERSENDTPRRACTPAKDLVIAVASSSAIPTSMRRCQPLRKILRGNSGYLLGAEQHQGFGTAGIVIPAHQHGGL